MSSLVAKLMPLAESLTRKFELQADVALWVYAGSDGAGKSFYAAVVTRKAILTRTNRQVRTFSGDLDVSSAQVAFLTPTEVGRFDKIVTPVNGVLDTSAAARDAAQPILGTAAFIDASNTPNLTEIFLGAETQPG